MRNKVLKLILLLGIFFNIQLLSAQKEAAGFDVSINNDSILAGHYFEVSYTINNLDGEFIAPDFGKLELVGGPNQSSSIQIINGDMSKTLVYTFYLKAEEPGIYTLPPAYLTGETEYETDVLEINIWPNPDGIPQKNLDQGGPTLKFDSPSFREFKLEEPLIPPSERPKKKKKYKTIKT